MSRSSSGLGQTMTIPDRENQIAEVELIASGYAWRCPECKRTEYENEVPAAGSVRCGRCGASFRLARVLHRVEAGAIEGLGDNGDSRAEVAPTSQA